MKSIISSKDISQIIQQGPHRSEMIASQMTSLINGNYRNVEFIQNQNWFQRMIYTVTGKNKAVLRDIESNREQLNQYMAEAISNLYEQNAINERVLVSLGNRINELCTEQNNIKKFLGDFAVRLNEKIESVDNFNMIEAEIRQGVYSNISPLVACIYVISQLDERMLCDERKSDIIVRTLIESGILTNKKIFLVDCLKCMMEIPDQFASSIYLLLSSITDTYLFQMFIDVMERYVFLPIDMRQFKDSGKVLSAYILKENISDCQEITIEAIVKQILEKKRKLLNEISVNENDELLKENSSIKNTTNIASRKKERIRRIVQILYNEHVSFPYRILEDNEIDGVPNELANEDLGEIIFSRYTIDAEKKIVRDAFLISENGLWTYYNPSFLEIQQYHFSYDELKEAKDIFAVDKTVLIKLTERSEITIARFFDSTQAQCVVNVLLDIIDILKE